MLRIPGIHRSPTADEFGHPMSVADSIAATTDRVVTPVQGMHRTIARQWLRPLGAKGAALGTTQDAVIDLVYGSIRFAGRMTGIGLERLGAIPPQVTDRMEAVVGGIWGAGGDTMSLRTPGGVSIMGADALRAAYPEATGHLAFLVHGLFETERCFGVSSVGPGLLGTMELHPDLTPVLVRYRSGSHIATSGRQLCALIEASVADWPVPVTSISLVGHSMGGLVIRGACEVAVDEATTWLPLVTDVVTVASPHLGSPIEKGVDLVERGLGVAEVTRPLADLLAGRSDGIKGLRHGDLTADDADSGQPSASLWRSPPVPLPPAIRHHFVAGSVTGDPSHPAGAAVGDSVVRRASATGGSALVPTSTMIVGGVTHRSVLHHPDVVASTIAWITASRSGGEPSA